MNVEPSERCKEVAKEVNLKPGEWVYFCERCPWVSPHKNAVMVPYCPECGAGLFYASEGKKGF